MGKVEELKKSVLEKEQELLDLRNRLELAIELEKNKFIIDVNRAYSNQQNIILRFSNSFGLPDTIIFENEVDRCWYYKIV